MLAAILSGVAAVCVPSARAFERSTVDGDPTTPLFWRYRWVTVRPAYDSSSDVPADRVEMAIARSIATWNAAAEGCSDFRLIDGGEPSGLATNLDDGEPDMENRIRWREDVWPEENGSATLALTTIVYRTASGQIIDADIDLNGVAPYWTSTDDAGEQIYTDVENTMTHELGHLLGLAHVDDPEATMFGMSSQGDIAKRSLEEDDIAGLCFIYPRGAMTPDAPLFRSTPLTSCAIAPRSSSMAWAALALIAIAARARARRRAGARDGTAS